MKLLVLVMKIEEVKKDKITKTKWIFNTTGAYIISLDENSNIGTSWVALYVENNDVTYFDSFRVEHIPKEIRTFISNKNIKTRTQAYDSIMYGYFCIGFIDFMLAGKTLTEFTNLFSRKNDDILLKYFITNI